MHRIRNLLLVAVLPFASQAADYSILDVQSVPLTGDPTNAVIHFTLPAQITEVRCDVLVGGAGMGGIGAALAIAGRHHTVCLTEETGWVGGQATAGGVSALDENRFIEFAGRTRSYMQFRAAIRDWYRRDHLTRDQENLNPGSCYVSPLCFEPKVGVEILERMFAKPTIQLFLRTAIFEIERRGSRIESALAWRFDRRTVMRIRPSIVLDATEMGDLLPLAHTPCVVGAEARSDTQEPDAAAVPNPACVQSFTYP
jgi:hypothetical protein